MALLLSLNYILLYTVAVAPFVLVFQGRQESIEGEGTGEEDSTAVDCSEGGEENGECADAGLAAFNRLMLIVNTAVIAYSVACELAIIGLQKRHAHVTCCNGYLLFQVLTGVTSRAVILLSAQLVAAFIRELDALSYIMGLSLGVALILSQLRAIHIFLAALKLDLTCLLPRLERNYEISLATNYLACAAIYRKLSAEPTAASKGAYKEIAAERKL